MLGQRIRTPSRRDERHYSNKNENLLYISLPVIGHHQPMPARFVPLHPSLSLSPRFSHFPRPAGKENHLASFQTLALICHLKPYKKEDQHGSHQIWIAETRLQKALLFLVIIGSSAVIDTGSSSFSFFEKKW